jgi:hypothetical protein
LLASELEPNAKSVSFFVGYGQAFWTFQISQSLLAHVVDMQKLIHLILQNN